MKEHYVTYSQAVKLKELGFDWKCTAHYSSDGKQLWGQHQEVINSEEFVSPVAPRLDQAQAWLREVKGWDVTSIPTLAKYGEKKYRWDICHWSKPEYGDCSNGIYDTYEQALSAGIDEALTILTNKS